MKKVLKSMFLLMVAGLYTATSWADSLIARWDNFTGLTSEQTLAPTASATVNGLNGGSWTFNLGGGTVTDGILATGTTTAPKIDFGGPVNVSRDQKPITVLVAVQLPLTPTADKPFFHIGNGSTGYGLVSVSSNKVAASWGNSAWNSSSKQATIDMSASEGTVYLVYSVANGSTNASVTSVTLDTTSYSWQTFGGLTGTGVNANQITFGNFVNVTSGGLDYKLKSVAVFNGAFAPLADVQSVIRGWEGVVENDVTATLSGNSTWGNVAWDNAPNNLSNVTLTVDAASTLTMSGETSILTLTANGSALLTIDGAKLTANSANINTDVMVNAGAASLGGVTIATDKILTVKDTTTTTSVAGAGTLNLDVGASTTLQNYALNTFTGTTKVSSGTLKYTAAANRPAGEILVSGENAALQIAETTDILGYSGGLPGITIENGARFEVFKRDTFSRVLTLDNGNLLFGADNQDSNRSFDLYTNSKIVSSGNSTIGGANATNDSESGDPIGASGIIAIRRDNLEIEVADGTLNVYSTFKKEAGNGVVYKKGAGTMAVYRPATSALAVTVNAGELRLVRKGSLTTGAMTIDAGATLTYVGDKTQGNTLTNNGAVVVEGEGSKLDLTGATLAGTGTYTAAAGTTLKLTLAQAKAVTLSIADGATLQVVLSDAEKLVAQEVPGVTKVVFVDAAGNALTEEGEEAGSNNTYAPAIPECVYAYTNGAWGWTLAPEAGVKVKVDFTDTEAQTVDLATLWGNTGAFSKLTIVGAGTVTVTAANIADIAEVVTAEGSTLAIAGTETATSIVTPITGEGKVAVTAGKIAIATAKSYTGGTDIAEGATVTVANATATLGTGAVTGAGTVVYTGALPPASAALSNAAWVGTVKIDAINAITDFDLTKYGNADSKIVLGNLGTSNTNLYFANDTKDVLSDIEIAGTVIFRNGYAAAAVNFKGAITGTGTLSFPDTSKSFGTLKFYGDVSGFTGTINCPAGSAGSATRKFVFCSNETTTEGFEKGVTVADNCTLTVNATYAEPIKVIGTIKMGSGTLQNRVEFKAGATLDASEGPLVSGNEVWVATGTNPTVLLPTDANEETVVLTCTNASVVCNELTSSDSKWTFTADGNNIKLALAQVTITLPEISNAKWLHNGVEVSGSIKVDPNQEVILTVIPQPGDIYVFADNAASKEVKVTVGDADVTVDAKDLKLPEVTAAKAAIGETLYASVGAACQVAADGATIVLLQDLAIAETKVMNFDKTLTIDFNDTKQTATADPAILVTAGNLTLKNGAIVAPGVVIQQGEKGKEQTTSVTIAEDMILGSMKIVDEETGETDGDNVVLLYGKATLVSEGQLTSCSKEYATIQGSGGDKGANTSITINGGFVYQLNGNHAIYQPQAGTVTINDGEIMGGTGIEMRAGTLTVNDGTITAGANYAVNKNGNGSTVIGAAIAVSPHAGVESITANITGGTIGDDETAKALAIVNTIDAMPPAISATIAAGTTIDMDKVEVDISDLEFKENNGSYTLGMKTTGAIIKNEWYETLQGAIAAAKDGDKVILLGNVEASEIITIEKAITLDGNGKTLTSTAGRAINVDCAGAVTIEDLTINAGERAINIINQAATVTINGVTATADNNAAYIAPSAGAVKLAIDGCNFTGMAVVYVCGENAQVTIANTTITNKDDDTEYAYGAITVWSTATNATVAVTNTKITVEDDSVEALNYADGATITGVGNVTAVVAKIGDAGYTTIEEAAGDVQAGQTIVLVADVSTATPLAIAGTIDLNGKTLTADIAGTIKMNGGTFATSQYTMVGADGKYTSTDAVFTIAANATYDMTVTAGTLTLNAAQWWTLEGQTITIGENAAIVIPAGKTLGINGSTIVVNGTATVAGEVQLLTKTSTIKAAEGLNVTTTVDGCEVAYVDGVYRVAVVITIPEEIYTSTNIPEEVKQALAEAMVEQGVTEIKSYTITTGRTDDDNDADAEAVAAVLEVFEVTPAVDANGELTVAYEFGISNITNEGDGKVTITAGVTGAEYRAGVEVAFYADGVEIGTATTTADSTEVSITNIQATDISGKDITVKAIK